MKEFGGFLTFSLHVCTFLWLKSNAHTKEPMVVPILQRGLARRIEINTHVDFSGFFKVLDSTLLHLPPLSSTVSEDAGD